MSSNSVWSRITYLLLTSLVALLCGCGLPDTVPQLSKPQSKSITATIVSLSSGDAKPSGDAYSFYGVDLYYKIFKRSLAATQLANDFQVVSAIQGDYRAALAQRGYLHLANPANDSATNALSPLYGISDSRAWTLTIDFSLTPQKTIDLYNGASISGSDKTSYYRLVANSGSVAYKPFSVDKLDTAQDSDLASYRNDTGFDANDTSVGIIAFTFAQDFDWAYVPLLSNPTQLGPFDIN